MTVPAVLPVWLHVLALGAGLAAPWARGRALRHALRDPEDVGAIGRALTAHRWWLAALAVWLVTGVWRLVDAPPGGLLQGGLAIKLALVAALLALEAWPTSTLARWRARASASTPRDAGRIEVISYVQCALVTCIVLVSVRSSVGLATHAAPDATPAAAPAGSAAVGGIRGAGPVGPPIAPSGLETVTGEDLALLTRAIAMPLDGIDPATLRSNFDERRGGGARRHEALDIMAARRTPIRSAASGRVLKLFTSAAGGSMVYAADSSERFVLLYAHLDGYAPGLADGAALRRGQLIGYVGSTGNASPSAPHLHFAIARSADVRRWSGGRPIDPLPVLAAAAAAR